MEYRKYFDTKRSLCPCRNSHYKDKTVSQLSDLYNGNPDSREEGLYIERVSAARMYPQGSHESKESFWLIFDFLISFSFMWDLYHQDTDSFPVDQFGSYIFVTGIKLLTKD